MEKTKKTYKIGCFKVVIQKCEKSKNVFFAKIAWHNLCQEGRKNAHFVHTICFGQIFFGPKQCKAGNTIKIGVSAEIAKKNKNDTFLGKRVFLTWLKKWVLLTVFLKSCVSWKHYFYSAFSKTQFFKNKNCKLTKNRKFMKNSGLFLNMAKWCFVWVCFFEVSIFKGLFLVCLVLFQKCSKCLFFPVLGVFLGWLIVVHLGLEGLGVFVFLVFVFFVLLLFLFCLRCSWFCGWMLLFFFLFFVF